MIERDADLPHYPDAPDPQTYEHGMEYQDWVRPRLACVGFNVQVNTSKKFQLQQGESAQGVEIKLDNRCCTPPYNQVSIEVEEKSRQVNGALYPERNLRWRQSYLVRGRQL